MIFCFFVPDSVEPDSVEPMCRCGRSEPFHVPCGKSDKVSFFALKETAYSVCLQKLPDLNQKTYMYFYNV